MATTTIKCPYCGTIRDYERKEGDDGMQIIYCDKEEGGCDNPFIVESKIILGIKEIRKIQGFGVDNE